MTYSNKPIQTLSWKDKIANDKEWFKDNIDYYISHSRFASGTDVSGQRNLGELYEVYNNKFPTKWFSHVTNPLSSSKKQHKSFPAKVRPVTILRTNLDLLMAEYPRRPFIYQVNNLSPDGYSKYQEELSKKIQANLTQWFQLSLQEQLSQQGLITPDGQPVSEEAAQKVEQAMNELELPETVSEKFHSSYKDNLAIQTQKQLRQVIREHSIRPKFGKMFKDWLIAGESYSYKTVEFSNLVYEKVSPIQIDFDKSPDQDYIEDGDWVIRRTMLTISDVVDKFYTELTKEDILQLEATIGSSSPNGFFTYLASQYPGDKYSKVPVYHAQWKSRKAIKFISYIDPSTGDPVELDVDEDYVLNEGEVVTETLYANEVYEGWRIAENLYLKLRAVPIQRNAMNNFSSCKLSYNGRKYSDTHSSNISVLEIGLPFQIMYIIVNRSIELTIAKSKGKILLIDQAAIPRDGNWDDEKFFYYAEALGYGLLNRNQIGVDKSWNQYQVLDMTLYDSLKQLIDLSQYFKQQWDDVLGINRQRKGQTYASDLVGVNERATFQSTVVTDMIFNLFEEFTERELQGIIDLLKFINVDGTRKLWNSTEFGNEVINIDGVEYCNAELGVFVEASAEAIARKNKIEGQVQAMLQNQVKPSTILEIIQTENIAELHQKLKKIEELEQKIAESNAQNEEEAQAQADERKKRFMEYQMMLQKDLINTEYDRKEDLETIKGTFNTFTFQDGDANDNGVPDAAEVAKMQIDKEKGQRADAQKNADRIAKSITENKKISLKEKELALRKQEMDRKERLERAKLRLNRNT